MKRGFFWSALLTVIAFIMSIVAYPQLSNPMPVHWNIHGQVDGYADKHWAAFLLPLLMAAMIGLFRALPWLSPRNFEVETFRPTYQYIMFVIVLLMGYINAIALYAALHPSVAVGKFVIGGVFLLFALIGNVLGKVDRNFYVGIRTPWTLADERAWHATHRLGGKVFVAAGLIGFLLILAGARTSMAFAVLLVAILIPVIYSLLYYKRISGTDDSKS